MPSATAPNRFLLWRRALSLSLLIGLLCGLSAALFLVALRAVTNLREGHLWLVWLLPVGGLLLGAAYERWGATAGGGTNRIIDALADGGNPLPGRLAPMVLPYDTILLLGFIVGDNCREFRFYLRLDF